MEITWIWSIIGLILLTAEMATGTLYILWFGVAGLCLSIATWIFPTISFAGQLVLYAILSLGSLWIWKMREKRAGANSRVGQAQGEEIGRIGIIVQTCSANQNGVIKFTQGLMGSKEWNAVSSIEINEGEQAKVVAVEGNSLRVEKFNQYI